MMNMLCPWEAPTYLIFSSNVPSLLFYSHGIAIIFALIFGVAIYIKGTRSLLSTLLFSIIVLFSTWVFIDLIQWATNSPSVLLFYWSVAILLEGLIFLLSVYLIDVYIEGNDITFGKKLGLFSLLIPIVALLATEYNLVGVDVAVCNATEGPIATYYLYALEIASLIWIAIFSWKKWRKAFGDVEHRKQITIFTVGLIIFLGFFIGGNLQSSFSDDWTLAQYGLFGMPIFIAFLSYMVVRFKAFNVKLLGAQVLVAALTIILATQFLFIRTPINRVLTGINIVFIVFFGRLLIKGVVREIKQRESLQELTTNLEQANIKLQSVDKLKTEFLSLASHQLRSPLTAIKGYTSMLLEGSFGAISDNQKEAIDRVFQSSSHLAKVVEDLLNVSKIEQGGLKYEMAPFDFEKVAQDLSTDLSITAQKKGLNLKYVSDGKPHTVMGDMEKIRQVVLNIIDNAIKYTEKGSVTVAIKHNDVRNVDILSVTDTGMGISPEEKEVLFQKFSRGEGGKTNTSGSGLGLYLAKQIAEAHGGHVGIDSPGVGKGSTFTIELKSVTPVKSEEPAQA